MIVAYCPGFWKHWQVKYHHCSSCCAKGWLASAIQLLWGESPGFVRGKKFTAFSMQRLLSLDLNQVLMHHLRPFLAYFEARQGPAGSLSLMPGKSLSKDSLPVCLPVRYFIILRKTTFSPKLCESLGRKSRIHCQRSPVELRSHYFEYPKTATLPALTLSMHPYGFLQPDHSLHYSCLSSSCYQLALHLSALSSAQERESWSFIHHIRIQQRDM